RSSKTPPLQQTVPGRLNPDVLDHRPALATPNRTAVACRPLKADWMTAENVSADSMRDSITPPGLEQLIAEPPKLHSAGGALTSRWKLQDADLRYLDQILRPGMRTLETGAGISTVVFALKGTDHTCIVPDQGLVDRIKSFCAESAIPLANVDFVVEHSERALPRLTRQDY